MIVRTGTPGADRFAGSGNEPFEFRGLGGNDTYTLRLFDIDVPPPPPVQGPPRTVYLRDRAVEAANGGTDTVNLVNQYGPVGFTGVYPTGSVGAAELANIETINALAAVRGSKILSWSIAAGASNNTITTPGGADMLNGGSGNDVLRSNAGNDTLTGGLGADKMYGGLGSDTYRVDSAGDLVGETGPTGVDRILSTVSINLGLAARAAGAIENVSLLGSAAISAIGNGWANSINGNAAANVLYGMVGNDVLNGGAGADRMFGGAGNDTYYVDRTGDVVSEATAGSSGTDRVVSSISFILPYAPSAAGAVENLTLVGAAAINGIGNAFANAILGNSAANTLSGLAGSDVLNGGAGADRMFGGAGNDTYYVDSGGDLVSEAVAGSSGIDRVVSSISFILPYAPQGAVEHLTLLGTGVANGTGNILANSITGNASNNVLNGRDGSDALTGGLGSDGFVFDTALDALANVDTIADFSNRGGDDSMRLDDAVFTQLPTGLGGFPRTLDAAHFRLATEVADADDYIIYNDQTGVLFYDADGSGGVSQAIQFATLTNKPTLTERDFVVF